MSESLIPSERIERCIYLIRGQKVMLDVDLAALYGVTTKAFNQAVKRNKERFPNDFVFVLSEDERDELVTNCDRFKNLKHSTALPYAFTEHGAIMVATVLRTKRAAEISVYIVRAFVRLRQMLSMHKELPKRLNDLERSIAIHDKAICSLFSAIEKLMQPDEPKPEPKKRPVGFRVR